MATRHSTGADAPLDQDDGMAQHAVLSHVLDEHPITLTVAELVSELARDPAVFGERDRIEQAVRDLVRVRLLYRHGPFVLPSRAALYFSDLWRAYE